VNNLNRYWVFDNKLINLYVRIVDSRSSIVSFCFGCLFIYLISMINKEKRKKKETKFQSESTIAT